MSFLGLPENLPIPQDDWASANLLGASLPRLSLQATDGEMVNLATLKGYTVIYIYPMTGKPGTPLPQGWDEIPGARGCTPQSCAFRDHFQELSAYGAKIFGLSSQDSDYQKEVKLRLHLPFEILSDEHFELKSLLSLPTFEIEGRELYKRLTFIVYNQHIVKVFYPIFPPNKNAHDVLAWFENSSIKRT